jgi:hypothetical protein
VKAGSSQKENKRRSVWGIALKRGDCALEGFAQNPAFAIGNRVEPLDGLGPRLDVELDISAGAVPPWLACGRTQRSGEAPGSAPGSQNWQSPRLP